MPQYVHVCLCVRVRKWEVRAKSLFPSPIGLACINIILYNPWFHTFLSLNTCFIMMNSFQMQPAATFWLLIFTPECHQQVRNKIPNIGEKKVFSWDLSLAQGHCSGCYSSETNPHLTHVKNHSGTPKTPKTNKHSLSL